MLCLQIILQWFLVFARTSTWLAVNSITASYTDGITYVLGGRNAGYDRICHQLGYGSPSGVSENRLTDVFSWVGRNILEVAGFMLDVLYLISFINGNSVSNFRFSPSRLHYNQSRVCKENQVNKNSSNIRSP